MAYRSQASNQSAQHLYQITKWGISSHLPFKQPVKTAVSGIPGSDGIPRKNVALILFR